MYMAVMVVMVVVLVDYKKRMMWLDNGTNVNLADLESGSGGCS